MDKGLGGGNESFLCDYLPVTVRKNSKSVKVSLEDYLCH